MEAGVSGGFRSMGRRGSLPLNESQAQMVLKTFGFGFHEQGRGAMFISTRNMIAWRGLLPSGS